MPERNIGIDMDTKAVIEKDRLANTLQERQERIEMIIHLYKDIDMDRNMYRFGNIVQER